jgi:uncharacterized protein DUF3551
MRAVFLAFVISAVVFSAGTSPASADDYPYCIQGDEYAGGAGECIFTTRAQCQASASGRMAYCTENRYVSANALLIDRNRLRHRSR